jgi:hypothetical protein
MEYHNNSSNNNNNNTGQSQRVGVMIKQESLQHRHYHSLDNECRSVERHGCYRGVTDPSGRHLELQQTI